MYEIIMITASHNHTINEEIYSQAVIVVFLLPCIYIIMHAVAILTGSGMSCYYSYVYTATYILSWLNCNLLAIIATTIQGISYKLTGNTIGIQLLSGLRTPAVRSHAVRMS